MSDFILPGDLNDLAQQTADAVTDAWQILTRMCIAKQYPIDIACNRVVEYSNVYQMSDIEAIRKVYHEVAKS